MVAAADAVVVSAGHEADKARALGAADPVTLPLPLPLPVVVSAEQAPGWAGLRTLGVLGFVYPGKGHEAVIEAAAARPDRPAVVAAGRSPTDTTTSPGPSPGTPAPVVWSGS